MTNVTFTSVALTTATTLYTDGDVLDSIWSWNVVTAKGLILGAVLTNKTVNMGASTLYLFDRSVTPAAVNAAHSISDADRLFAIGIIEFPYPSNDALGQTSTVDSIAVPYIANASTTIYGIAVTRSTHTVHFGAVGDLQCRLLVSGDV
jgi:hypothetical protein